MVSWIASGVVRLWVTTIAEILQKIYILEGIAQKKGEIRVASPFVVVEPVIQNKIWVPLVIHIQ